MAFEKQREKATELGHRMKEKTSQLRHNIKNKLSKNKSTSPTSAQKASHSMTSPKGNKIETKKKHFYDPVSFYFKLLVNLISL
jgi:hypothetical protein